MSLEHSPTRQIRQRKIAPAVPAFADDDEVLSFREWCRVNGISTRTGRRIIADPDPDNRPVITQLSARRIGVSRRNNRIWQQSRERR